MSRDAPLWAYLLEITGGDPLRAQTTWNELNEEWYGYWQCWLEEKAKCQRYS